MVKYNYYVKSKSIKVLKIKTEKIEEQVNALLGVLKDLKKYFGIEDNEVDSLYSLLYAISLALNIDGKILIEAKE